VEPDAAEILKLIQGGGNAALMVAVYFIYKAANRLARIELILEILLLRAENDGDSVKIRKTDLGMRHSELQKMLRERERDS
jgi:hypothetical protein